MGDKVTNTDRNREKEPWIVPELVDLAELETCASVGGATDGGPASPTAS